MDRELRADVSICRVTRSRLSDFSHCVCLALCVRRAGGEDSTRLPAPTSHPTSLPNRPALPDCTNPAPTAQLLCLKDLEQTRPFFSFACLCEKCVSVSASLSHRLGKLRPGQGPAGCLSSTPPSASYRKFYLKSPR